MKVGFAQTSPEFGQLQRNVSRAAEMIESVDADLMVLPELFSTGYLFEDRRTLADYAEPIPDGPTCVRMIDLARKTKTALVFGIAEKEGDRIYDSSAYVTETGKCFVYRKLHLFCDEKTYFDPGDLPLEVYSLGDCRLGMTVCFDWVFPEAYRVLALKGAHIVCHPANLVLHYCQEVMRTRSIENRIFTVTANRVGSDSSPRKTLRFTGCSQVTAPDGEILFRADDVSESVHVIDIDLRIAEQKRITDQNDVLADRRPEFYRELL